MIAKVCTFPLRCVEGLQGRSAAAYRESAWLRGLPTLKLPNQDTRHNVMKLLAFFSAGLSETGERRSLARSDRQVLLHSTATVPGNGAVTGSSAQVSAQLPDGRWRQAGPARDLAI